MKNILFLFSVLCLTTASYSQDVSNYDKIKLDKADDFRAADTIALQAANLLLSNPIGAAKLDRLKCQQFLLKWMSGTPDFGFTFGESTKILNNDLDLMGIYMASMVKFCLDNRSLSKDQDKVKIGTWKLLLAYC
jgi:hypothetical protein